MQKLTFMIKKALIFILAILPSYCCLLAQQNVTYQIFLNYSSRWNYSGYFSNPTSSGSWKEILHIKGDTAIANQWYYKVYKQYQSFDSDYKLKELKTTYAYALRESMDSSFTYIYPNGNQFVVSHATSVLITEYNYTKPFLSAQIPFVVYYDDQQFGGACGLMQGIGVTNCPPNTNGVAYFECYSKNGLSTNVNGEKCKTDLLVKTSETKTGSIQLFPNPLENKLNIHLDDSFLSNQPINYIVYNSQGILQEKDILQENKSIDMSFFPKGIYFIKLQIENDFFVKKIIKN